MIKKNKEASTSSRISKGVFLIGLSLVLWTQLWWPGIAIAGLVALWTGQILDKNYKDANVSMLIIFAILISLTGSISWRIIIAAVLAIKGMSLIFGKNIPLKAAKSVKAEVDVEVVKAHNL
ncbi:MAG: hypothetical protein CMO81_11100 [Waddliaceae bacterium]|nr:hypothetical protein [Waddliaceae bacterium]